MKIVCLVKIVPDVDKFKFDFENNRVVRENVRMVLNPDDACGVAFALKVKAAKPDTRIEVVTMAPRSVIPIVSDLVRRGVDTAYLISDSLFSGSDSYATSLVLATFLKTFEYDCIITGTHAIDGDTSHVPAQVAELLNINQMSNIVSVEEAAFDTSRAVFKIEDESAVCTYEMALPGILSMLKESKYKLPYIKLSEAQRDVGDQIRMITNKDLKLDPSQLGVQGSLTKVNRTFVKAYEKRNRIQVDADEHGVEQVYSFLKDKGFV